MNYTFSPSDIIIMDNNNTMFMDDNNFEMCARDFGSLFYQDPDYSAKYPLILSTIGAQSSLMNHVSIQTISIITASFIAFFSMIYQLISRYFYPKGLTLHFVGIRRPDQFTKSQYKLLEKYQTESTLISIQTPFQTTATIKELTAFIQKIYNLENKEILISYAGHIISKYHESDEKELAHFGIADNSILTLAISNTAVIPENKYDGIHREWIDQPPEYECIAEPVQNANVLFDMFQDEEDSDDDDEDNQYEIPETKEEEHEPQFLEPYLGFDVIMQEGGVMVYKMPTCGHEMNKESLFDYCLNTFTDNANLKLTCPHRTRYGKCNAEWDLNAVLEVLRHEHVSHETGDKPQSISSPRKDWIDVAKLELLASRNAIENGGHNVQKCPRCQTLYFKEKAESKLNLDEIKSMYHIQQEFKTQCIYCQPSMPQYLDQEKLCIKKSEDQIAKEEGSKMNSLFGMFEDEEEEELAAQQLVIEAQENEERELLQGQAVNSMFNMFEDPDDIDDEEEKVNKFKPEYDENGYRILSPTNCFCFCCGEEWIEGHICDNAFRRELIEILKTAPVKKIGYVENVPSVRACPNPNCSQLLFHIEYCKHMHCSKGCKKRFCMVCLKPKKDGKWQCGGSSDRCPVAPRQDDSVLPDNIVITKQKFTLFERAEEPKDENDA